jgi:HSP20 family protein
MADNENKKEAKASIGSERVPEPISFNPDVDIIETDDEIRVIADMPGADEKSINVTLENEILSLSAGVAPRGAEGFREAVREYSVGNYQRSFRILSDIDTSNVQARIKNGVLRVVLPKSRQAKRRVIPIATE